MGMVSRSRFSSASDGLFITAGHKRFMAGDVPTTRILEAIQNDPAVLADGPAACAWCACYPIPHFRSASGTTGPGRVRRGPPAPGPSGPGRDGPPQIGLSIVAILVGEILASGAQNEDPCRRRV